jgi:hypothetical protein
MVKNMALQFFLMAKEGLAKVSLPMIGKLMTKLNPSNGHSIPWMS